MLPTLSDQHVKVLWFAWGIPGMLGVSPVSLAQFIARLADLLCPERIVLGHHDYRNPPLTRPTDVEPIPEELARHSPGVELVEMGYSEEYPILRRDR